MQLAQSFCTHGARCTVGPGEALLGAGPQLLQLLSPPRLDQVCILSTWCTTVKLGASASECLDQAHMSPFPRASPRIPQLHPVLWQVCVVLAIASPRLPALPQPVLPGFKCTWLADSCYCMPAMAPAPCGNLLRRRQFQADCPHGPVLA